MSLLEDFGEVSQVEQEQDQGGLLTDFGIKETISKVESTVDYLSPLVERYSPSIEGEPSTMDFLKGLPEAAASLVGGIGGFLAGAPVAAGETLKGVLAGEPVEGLRRGGQEWDKIMEAAAFQPETRFGKVAAGVMGQPFVDIQDVVGNAVRGWSDKDIEKRVEAAKTLTNFGFIGAPYIKKGVKKLTEKSPVLEGVTPTKPPVSPSITPAEPTLDLSKTLAEVDRLAKAKKPTPVMVEVPANQEVVEMLKEKLAGVEGDSPKAGYQRGYYNGVIKLISEMKEDLGEVDLSTLKGFKDPKGKTRQLVEELLAKKREQVVPAVESIPTPTSTPAPEPIKTPVTFVGMWQNAKGEPTPLVVESLPGEPHGTSRMFDPTQHEIVNVQDYEKALKVEPTKVEETLEEKIVKLKLEEEKGEIQDAQTVRENEGRVSEGGTLPQEITGESSQDLQLKGKEERVEAGGEEGTQVVPYVYHTTKESNLKSIKSEGLKPTDKSDIHISLNESDAKKWSSIKGSSILRFKPIEPLLESTYPETRKYGNRVDPINIEVLKDGKWEPLISTKVEEKIISEFDTSTLARDEGYTLDSRSFTTEKSASAVATRLGPEWEVVKVGKNFKAAKWSSEPTFTKVESKIPESSSMEELTKTVEVGSEISEKQALKEWEQADEEFSVAKVGDKYYRVTKKATPLAEEVSTPTPTSTPTKIEPLTELPPVSEDFVQKVREEVKAVQKTEPKDYKTGTKEERDAAVAAAYEKYKNSLVEKINRAKESKIEPGDLGVFSDEFQTFASKEEAIKFGKDPSKLIQDKLTKRWFEEVKFEDLEDLGWEQDRGDLNLKSDEIQWSDDFEVRKGEVSEGRVKDLWDILGNERGSGPALVNPENLRVFRDKIKEHLRKAKKLGVSIEDYLTGLGASQKTKEDFAKAVEQFDDLNRKVKEGNPIVESIFNPKPESVVSQVVKASKKKKGTFLVEVPYTKFWEDTLRNTINTQDRWGKNFAGNFMKFNEIPMKAFKRMGLDELWWDWVKQESRRLDYVRSITKEFRTLEKTFTKKELKDMAIVTESRRDMGTEILAEMGITEIPILSPKQESALKVFNRHNDRILEEMNYVRTHTGREPIPRDKNYFTRVRQFNVLKSKGLIGALSNEPLETFSKMTESFKGKYNPYSEKLTKVTDIPVELDIFSNFYRYLDYVGKDIYISPVAALAKKLSGSKIRMDPKDLGKEGSYLASLHPGAAELLRRWSDEILGVHLLGDFYKEYAGLKTMSDWLHRNIVYSTILFAPVTVAKQSGAFTGTIAEAGIYHTLRGIGKFAVENPKSLWKGELTRARAKSDVLKIRGYTGESYFENLHDQWVSGKIGKVREGIAKVGGYPMYLNDYFTAEASWNAFYDFARNRKHMSEPDAFRFAEDRTAKTQVIGIRGATAPIQNIPGLNLFTIFQTFAIGDFNYVARDLLKIKNPEPTNLKHFTKVARYVIGAYLLNSAFQQAGIDEPHPAPFETYKETKEEGGSKKLAWVKAFTEYFEKLPQIGGVLKYSAPLGGPTADLMKDIPLAAQALVGMVDWDTMTKQQKIRSCILIADVIGRSKGVPGTAPFLKSARTYAAGGNKWEVLMGIWIDSKKRHRQGRMPSLKENMPSLP